MEKLLFAGWVPRGTPRKGESGSQDGSARLKWGVSCYSLKNRGLGWGVGGWEERTKQNLSFLLATESWQLGHAIHAQKLLPGFLGSVHNC